MAVLWFFILLLLAASLGAQTYVVPADSSINAIRLVDGPSENEGRVEIMVDFRWGTICDDYFDYKDAKVICGMLGFQRNGRARQDNNYPASNGQILLDNVQCIGTETSLSECSHAAFGVHDCSHSEDVILQCDVNTIDDVRLVGGSSPSVGRVEILVNNSWGTVCEDEFDVKAAIVFCKMLGYRNPIARVKAVTEFGQGSGQIWLDDVMCTGKEDTLEDCRHKSYGDTNCAHHRDVAVQCQESLITGVRLVDGPSSSLGRLEISVNNTRLKVCDTRDYFDKNAAAVVCNMLGFGNRTAIIVQENASSAGMLWTYIGDCNPRMNNLAECNNHGFGVDPCGLSPGVYMSCAMIDTVRLAGGSALHGRAEVFVAGQWGTICDDDFNDNAATVFCRMMGRPSGVFDLATMSPGTGWVWLDDVTCQGHETSLHECSIKLGSYNDCTHQEDVWVRCAMSRPSQSKLHPHHVRFGIDRSLSSLTINFQKTIQIENREDEFRAEWLYY